MYFLYSFLFGALLSVMISINGSLAQVYGIYVEAAFVHLVGTLAALVFLLVRKQRFKLLKGQPLWIYLGGAVGVLTTLFQTFSFGKISLASITALGLLGEALTSLCVDTFGLFHSPRIPFNKKTLIGLAFSALGIVLMLDSSVNSAALPVLLCLLTGTVIVVSRMINARLSDQIGALPGSLINHAVGLPITVLIAFIMTRNAPVDLSVVRAPAWMFLGGVIGVFCIAASNRIVPHISAFHLTLLAFLGQITGGTILDFVLGTPYSRSSVLGAACIAGGMILNMLGLSQSREQFQNIA